MQLMGEALSAYQRLTIWKKVYEQNIAKITFLIKLMILHSSSA